MLRVGSGEVLHTSPGLYWSTGQTRANRIEQFANWSKDRRLMIESGHTRFDTESLTLFAFGADGTLEGSVDLLQPVRDALVAQTKRRNRDAESLSFTLANVGKTSSLIKNGLYSTGDVIFGPRGTVRLKAYLWAPKDGPFYTYNVTLQVSRGKTGPAARIRSVTRTKAPF